MLTIHRSLRHFAKAASKENSGGYCANAITGVYIEEGKRGRRTTLKVCDNKTLIEADAPNLRAQDLPEIPGFDAKANGAKSAIIPAGTFTKVMRFKSRGGLPALDNVAVTLQQDKMVTFAHTDLETASVTPSRTIEGTYPDTSHLFNRLGKPKFTLHINARNLARTLRIIADALKDAEEDRTDTYPVRLDFFGEQEAVQVSAGAPSASCGMISALVMPLVADKGYPASHVKRWKR